MNQTVPLIRRALPPTAAQLAACLKSTAFLLNSAQLVITDPVSRGMVRDAVSEAQALLRRFEGKQT